MISPENDWFVGLAFLSHPEDTELTKNVNII
jgi:hypothetical protein